MYNLTITILICMIVLTACKNKINTYENKVGINPASLAGIDTANYTKILWEDSLKNFGKINEGDSVFMNFNFKNTGKTALFILEVFPGCGCTLADFPRSAFLPGQTGFITVIFDSHGHPGIVTKNVLVKTNTKNKIVQKLEFSGEVIKMVQETK